MRTALHLLVLATALAGPDAYADWITAPSYFTHDPVTGLRTNQYSPPPPAFVPQAVDFQSSGYTHLRSSIQVGQSADNYHRVEKWGPPVQPYGEWRFPYRPYSVPYDLWGAPWAGFNLGGGLYGHPGYYNGARGGPAHRRGSAHRGDRHPDNGHPGFPGHGHPGGGQPGQPNVPYPSGPDSPYPVPPYADGYYPSYPFRPRLDDEQFFNKPTLDPRE